MKRTRTLTVLIALVVAGAAVAVPAATAQQEAPEEAGTSFSVESLTAPESAAPGSNVSVAAEISNEGEAGVEEVEFRVGGAVVDRKLVSLDAGENKSVQFSANTEGLEGDLRHGVFTASDGQIAEITISESFALTDLDAPANATAGDEITVEAGVQNPNDFETEQDVTFRLAGAAVASQSVELADGEESTVTFNVSTEGVEAGTYVHSVFTRDDGQFAEIEITSADNETEEPAPNETEEPEATETEEPAATETEEPAATETEEPAATETEEPAATETEEPAATETEEPAATETEEPAATETEEPAATETEEPAATETEEPEEQTEPTGPPEEATEPTGEA